jgi:uncharacterized alpha-E superfamily protein
MARYMERAENLARILEVNETFARDVHGANDWLPILRLHCDEERFFEHHKEATSEEVVPFYIIDSENPNSIIYSVRSARENARSIRHLISLETWVQLNVFYNWVASLTPRNLSLSEVARLCGRIKEACQLHYGIVTGTLYRDQVWSFYRLGTFTELADQITRLVDIKYHALLPSWKDVGSPVDIAQWNALLRSASAYHGYRRVYPAEMTPTTVAGFILLSPRFPRSLPHCVNSIEVTLDGLLSDEDLQGVSFRRDAVEKLKSLTWRSPDSVIKSGLHEYLDEVQVALLNFSDEIAGTFFHVQKPGQ